MHGEYEEGRVPIDKLREMERLRERLHELDLEVGLGKRDGAKRLTEIPTEEFPFSLGDYTEIADRLKAIGERFDALGHGDIAGQFDRVFAELHRGWNLVQVTERRERGEE